MDYYDALGVEANASLQDIRKAYRAKAKISHPDRCGDVGLEQMKEINEAYFVLSHAARRKEYDVTRDDCDLDVAINALQLKTTAGRAQSEKFSEKFLHWPLTTPSGTVLGAGSTFGASLSKHVQPFELQKAAQPVLATTFLETVLYNLRHLVLNEDKGKSNPYFYDELWITIKPTAIKPWRTRYACADDDLSGEANMMELVLQNIDDGFVEMALNALESMTIDRWDLCDIIHTCLKHQNGVRFALELCQKYGKMCDRRIFHSLLEIQDIEIQREVYKTMISVGLKPDRRTAELCRMARVAFELSEEIFQADVASGQIVPLFPISPLCDIDVLRRFASYFVDVPDNFCAKEIWVLLKPYLPWTRVLERSTKMSLGKTTCAACNVAFRGAPRQRCGACRDMCCVKCATLCKVNEMPHWGVLREVEVCSKCDRDIKKRRREGWSQLARSCESPRAKLRMAFLAEDDALLLDMSHKGHEADALRLLACAHDIDYSRAERLLETIPAVAALVPKVSPLTGLGLATKLLDAFRENEYDTCVDLCERLDPEAARVISSRRPDTSQLGEESTALWRMIRGCALCVLGYAFGLIEVQRAAWSGYFGHDFRELGVGMRFHRLTPRFKSEEAAEAKANSETNLAALAHTASEEAAKERFVAQAKAVLYPLKLPEERSRPATTDSASKTPRVAPYSATPRAVVDRSTGKGGPQVRLPEKFVRSAFFNPGTRAKIPTLSTPSKPNPATTKRSTVPPMQMSQSTRSSSADIASCSSSTFRIPSTPTSTVNLKSVGKPHAVPVPIPVRSAKASSVCSHGRSAARESSQASRDGTGRASRNPSHEPSGPRTPTASGFRTPLSSSHGAARKLSVGSNLRCGKTHAPSTPQLKTQVPRASAPVVPRETSTTQRVPPLDLAGAPQSLAMASTATSVSRRANSRAPSIDRRVKGDTNESDAKRMIRQSASVKLPYNKGTPLPRAHSVSGSATPRVSTSGAQHSTRARGSLPPPLPVKRPAQPSAESLDSLGASIVRRESLDEISRRGAAPPPRTCGSRLRKHLGTQSTTAGTQSISRSSSLGSRGSSFSANSQQTPASLSRSSSQDALPSSGGHSHSVVRQAPHFSPQQKVQHPQVPQRQQQLRQPLPHAVRSSSAAPPPKTMKSSVRTPFSANATTSRANVRNGSTIQHSRTAAPLSARSIISTRNPPLSARSTTSVRNPPLSARSQAGKPSVSARSRAATPLGVRPCTAVKTADRKTASAHEWLFEEIRIGTVARLVNLTQQFEYNDLVGVVTELGERYTVHVGADVSVKVKASNLEAMDGLNVWKKDAMTPPKMVDGSLVRRWPCLSVQGMESKALTRYEAQIHKNCERARDIGLAYVDCAQFSEDIGAAPVTVSWLRAAQWFALELPLSKDAICTSLRHALAAASSDFGLLSLVCRIGLGILARLDSESDEVGDAASPEPPLAVLLAEKYRIVSMMEAFNGPFNFALSECSVYQIISRRMNASYLLGLQVYPGIVPQDILWSSLWDCHFLGVCELENGEAARIAAMHAFLESQHYSVSKIQNVLHSPWIGRGDDGWLQCTHSLPLMPIKTLFGVSVSKGTQAISLVYDRPNDKSDNDGGFLSWRDVTNLFAMQEESLPLYFSLDPLSFPYRRCPLYGCCALPRSYAHTDAMQSIAHADWLLKQLVAGAEVNAQTPFATRPLTFEEKWLQPLPQRGSRLLGPHRVWLACESIEYEVAENEDCTTMHFGKVKFQLRSHLKTLEDEEDVDRDHVMETFCHDLSTNWDKLKKKFAIFQRLEEIAKLQFVAKFLSNYQGTFDASRAAEVAARIKATRPPGAVDKISSRITAHFADQRERISRELLRLKKFSKRFQQKSDNDTLRYLPGVFQMEPRCYGGILMYPKLKRCNFTIPPNVEIKRLNDCFFASSSCGSDSRQKSEPSRKTCKDTVACPASNFVVPVDGEHSVNLPKGPHFQGHLKVKEAMQVAKILQAPMTETYASSTQEDMCGLFLEATLRTKYLGASQEEAADYVATRCERGVRNVPSPPRGGRRS